MTTLIIFAFLTLFLLMKLNSILGIRMGFKVDKKDLRDFSSVEVKEVSSLEEKLQSIKKLYGKFDTEDFLKKSRQAFEIIFKAYSEADKMTLKDLLSPRTYKAFSMAIDDREKRGETLEGSLVNFAQAEIIDANITDENILVTVKFITEQSNVLKAADGTILEGSPDFVETRTDIWVFSRKRHTEDSRWFLYEIKSENQD